jgi:hypothetical protein
VNQKAKRVVLRERATALAFAFNQRQRDTRLKSGTSKLVVHDICAYLMGLLTGGHAKGLGYVHERELRCPL